MRNEKHTFIVNILRIDLKQTLVCLRLNSPSLKNILNALWEVEKAVLLDISDYKVQKPAIL